MKQYCGQRLRELEAEALRQEALVRELERRLAAARSDLMGMYGGMQELKLAVDAFGDAEQQLTVKANGKVMCEETAAVRAEEKEVLQCRG
jgi:hypothetical protein